MTDKINVYEYHITLSDGRVAVVWEYGKIVELQGVIEVGDSSYLTGGKWAYTEPRSRIKTEEGIEQ